MGYYKNNTTKVNVNKALGLNPIFYEYYYSNDILKGRFLI